MKNKQKIMKMIVTAILIALAIVLQALATFTKISTYALPLGLIPVIVAAVLYGPLAGLLVGAMWGSYILIYDPSCSTFLNWPSHSKGVNFMFTFTAVVIRGALDGLFAGLLYKLILFGVYHINYLLKDKIKTTRGIAIFSEFVSVLINAFLTCLINNVIFWSCVGILFGIAWPTFAKFFTLNLGIMVIVSIISSPIIARICIASQDVLNLHSKKYSMNEENVSEEA